MNSINFDENTIHKLQDMMNKGELNNLISQIPPDMVKNFSSMINQNASNDSITANQSSSNNSKSSNSNFNFNNIDINTILKIKSIMEKMNDSNDPRSNLLYSLKPYLRDEKKEKLDQYANFLNFAKIANILNENNKENPGNG